MKLIPLKSPNQNARPVGTIIDTIVLHADASAKARASIDWIERSEARVSYHTLIDRNGTVYTFVPLARRAWHAGVSSFMGRPNCNDYSIGVSFANRNDGKELITEAQLSVGAAVCASYMRLYPAITLDRITTHAIVSPGRKTDPCPPFDMEAFRELVAAELASPYPRPAA